MAYIDLSKVTDRHAKIAIDKSPDLVALALDDAEVMTRVVAREFEVHSADIPLDGSGYIQSEMLYIYCKWAFQYSLFQSLAGSFAEDDIYGVKLLLAERKMQETKNSLSKCIITETEVVEPQNRNVGIPIL